MSTNILSSVAFSFFGVTSIGVTSSPLLVAGGRSTDIIPLLGLFLGGGAGLLSTDPLDGGDRVPLTTVSATVALVGLGCDEDVDTLEVDLAGLVLLVGVGISSNEYPARKQASITLCRYSKLYMRLRSAEIIAQYMEGP